MTAEPRMSLLMREAMFKFSQAPGHWLSETEVDGRSCVALARRGLVRRASLRGWINGFALTSDGLAYVHKHWPSSPAVMGNDDEPEGGWTPREGVGW